MARLGSTDDLQNDSIVLGLLESVERDGRRSQRRLASELNIALGLVNSYLKRCVMKGLVKVSEAPARRYAYYLTPEGFAEKSRLTVNYLSYSFSLFRRARAEYSELIRDAHARGYRRIVFVGLSDLTEIVTLCMIESGVAAVAIVDSTASHQKFLALPLYASLGDVPVEYDAVVVTDLRNGPEAYAKVVETIGADRVLAPALLGLNPSRAAGVSNGP